ncbi:U32 family peptidase [bacterium]|nr:U32 family peptidase [bacterium]
MKIAEFSVPMPYDSESIDKLTAINESVEKSKITNVYLTLPPSCDLFTGFEQDRNVYIEKKEFEYWENLMSYSLKKGFDVIYLLNTYNIVQLSNNNEQDKRFEKLNKLLPKLKEIGVNKIRITNPLLIMYLKKLYPNFQIYASTSLEFKTIREYQQFLTMYPDTKQIVPSADVNKNFKLLKNLRKNYPNLDIEIMVSQACIKGCPHRNFHQGIEGYGIKFCTYLYNKNIASNLCNANNIYPWEIQEYLNIGINKFKLVGRDSFPAHTSLLLNKYNIYLKAFDNIKSVENEPFSVLLHYIPGNFLITDDIKIKDIKSYLTQIDYFKKNGHLCSSECNSEGFYCFNCAKKINEQLKLEFTKE